MKKIEIEKGHTYTDGKGNQRQVIELGENGVLYAQQLDRDTLRYKLTAKKRGPGTVGRTYSSTRASFATWAKTRVS